LSNSHQTVLGKRRRDSAFGREMCVNKNTILTVWSRNFTFKF